MQFRMGDDGHIFERFGLVNSSYLENNEDRNSAWSGGQREQLDNRGAQPLMGCTVRGKRIVQRGACLRPEMITRSTAVSVLMGKEPFDSQSR